MTFYTTYPALPGCYVPKNIIWYNFRFTIFNYKKHNYENDQVKRRSFCCSFKLFDYWQVLHIRQHPLKMLNATLLFEQIPQRYHDWKLRISFIPLVADQRLPGTIKVLHKIGEVFSLINPIAKKSEWRFNFLWL